MFQPIIWKCYNNHFQKSWMDSGWILYCFKICDLESHVWAGRRLAESEKSPKCLRFFTKTLLSFSFTQNNFTLSHQQKKFLLHGNHGVQFRGWVQSLRAREGCGHWVPGGWACKELNKALQRRGNGIKNGLFRQTERRPGQEFQGTTV